MPLIFTRYICGRKRRMKRGRVGFWLVTHCMCGGGGGGGKGRKEREGDLNGNCWKLKKKIPLAIGKKMEQPGLLRPPLKIVCLEVKSLHRRNKNLFFFSERCGHFSACVTSQTLCDLLGGGVSMGTVHTHTKAARCFFSQAPSTLQ